MDYAWQQKHCLGLASLPAATSLALMAGPAYLTYAGSKELDRIKKMTPEERAAHSEKSKQFGMSYLDDEMFNQQFTPKLDDIVKSNEDIKEEVKISKNANQEVVYLVQEVVKMFKQIDLQKQITNQML